MALSLIIRFNVRISFRNPLTVFSIVTFLVTTFFTLFARCAKCNVDSVSCACSSFGVMVATMDVNVDPPKESFNKNVNFESR
jgi:hypothetical protein